MTPNPAIAISRRSMAAGLLTGVCLLSAVVFARRSVGAARDLSSAGFACSLAAIVMLLGIAAAMNLTRREDRDHAASWLQSSLAALPGLLLGLALMPTQSSAGLGALLMVFLLLTAIGVVTQAPFAVTTTTIKPLFRDELNQVRSADVTTPTQVVSNVMADADHFSDALNELASHGAPTVESHLERPAFSEELDENMAGEGGEAIPHPSVDPDVMQWMTRAERDGVDTFEGAMKVRFAPRAKQVAVHLPFVPPFAAVPVFEAEPLEDADIEITVTSLHGYGIRFEVTRKGRLDQPANIPIGYCASAPLSALRAA